LVKEPEDKSIRSARGATVSTVFLRKPLKRLTLYGIIVNTSLK
jgi:hypothetical protein